MYRDLRTKRRNQMAQTIGKPGIESKLEGKRVVVLGGSSGIGLEVSRQLVAEGAEVIIASSNAKRVEDAVAGVGGKATGHAVDLMDEAAIEAFFQQLGAFDHLVYTAADSLQLNELSKTDLKAARQAFELRYWSALAAVKYASPNIRPGGSIVLTTGIAGQRPHKGWVVVSSVAAMLEGLTRALAVELAPLRVNCVSPGVVRTNLWQSMSEQDREAMYENIGSKLLVGRVGEAPEIASAYLYLMQQGYSTGQVIVVDGGTSLV
jgi:NAD(P)-dependent dehydrogenase (short-subunit alcohol dehydrogenase family)